MAKFVIECPSCGRYAEAGTGFFARKKIDCACGHVIDVRLDKLTGRVCPHCGNDVVFDQSKGAAAKCPVCREPINTMAEQDKMAEFSCRQCGVRLRTAKSAAHYICPVCDYDNDVAERVTSEEIRSQGLASVTRCEGAAMGLAAAGTSGLGQIPSAGFIYCTMDDVMDTAKQAVSGMANPVTGMSQSGEEAIVPPAAPDGTWNCVCGNKGITFKFCPACGSKKPEPQETWDCPQCGAKGITFKFCPECGAKKPEPPKPWDCPRCGNKGITFKFCPECGAKKPEAPQTWNCPQCGTKNIKFKFCPECGAVKPE